MALHPVSFRLTEDEIARMDVLANDHGLPNRVDLLRRAISEFGAQHDVSAVLIDNQARIVALLQMNVVNGETVPDLHKALSTAIDKYATLRMLASAK